MFEAMATATVQAEQATDLVGRWEGALNVGGTSLPLVIWIAEGPDGLVAAMDSPAQGAHGISISDLTEAGGVVRFVIPSVNGRFEGSLSADRETLTGAWSQGPASLPLILTRAAATGEVAAPPARPQTPAPPFPYAAEDVSFTNAGAGVVLAGTLTLPEGSGPFPAVVLLTGSGAQDRDETIAGHKPFAIWADALTRRGVAVLRYDDRGVGGSGGGSLNETPADFATDARAAMDFLRSRPEIDPARIGLVGHSEGGTTALIATSTGAPAAFVVMIAGPAVTGAEIINEQAEQLALAGGATSEQAERTRAAQARFMTAVVDNKDDGPAAARAVEALLIEAGQSAEQARGSSAVMASGWYRYIAAYDPAPALTGLTVPLLAVYGDKDRQVTARQNAGALARLKPDADIVVLPGLNHLMQTAETGLPGEYAEIEETLAPAVLTAVVDWIARTAGAHP